MIYKAMVVIVKCEHCEEETAKLIPLEISEADWHRTRKKYGEMVVEY